MPDCPNTARCPLFPLFAVKSLLELWKVQYCSGDFTRCERYQRSQAGQPIPPNLLPNGSELPIPEA